MSGSCPARWNRTVVGLALVLPLAACSDLDTTNTTPAPDPGGRVGDAVCQLPDSLFADGGLSANAIPALTGPRMVGPEDPGLGYLDDDSRVLGVVIDGQPRDYPHNILWWHEIVNERVGGVAYAVTFCPLTGSGIVFDRGTMGNSPDLGVSGLLFANNLVTYDRETGRLVGPQLAVEGRCGDFTGIQPTLLPVMETSWRRWKRLHPRTTVVSEVTGHRRNYRIYPYGDYDIKTNPILLFPMAIDRTRPAKERVLGVRTADGGVGYPFDELAELGALGVVEESFDGRPAAVFWEAREGGTAVAYDRRVAGEVLTFEAVRDGYRDVQTGSLWDLAGRAVAGPLEGSSLDGIGSAYVAFWFAWKHFQPRSRIWTP
jgi:hypothetical protein